MIPRITSTFDGPPSWHLGLPRPLAAQFCGPPTCDSPNHGRSGKAAMAETHLLVGSNIDTAIVRTAMPDGLTHDFYRFSRNGRGERNFTSDATHK